MPQSKQEKAVDTVPAKDTKPIGIVSPLDTSGHLANRGPIEPLHSTAPHKPLGASNKEQETCAQEKSVAQAIAMEPEVGKCGDMPEKNKKSKKEIWKERRARRAASKKIQNEKGQSVLERQKPAIEPVPLGKQGNYYEGESENTMLPVEYAGHSIMAILDGGAGMAIITKKVWELWGKPTMKQTRIKLLLADGNIKEPIGLLKRVIATSCGV